MALDAAESLVIGAALVVVLAPAAWTYVRFPSLKEELDAAFFRRAMPLALLFAGVGFLVGVTPGDNPRTQLQDALLFAAIGLGTGFLSQARLGGVLIATGFVAGFGTRVAWMSPDMGFAGGRWLLTLIGIHALIIAFAAVCGWIGGWLAVILERVPRAPPMERRT